MSPPLQAGKALRSGPSPGWVLRVSCSSYPVVFILHCRSPGPAQVCQCSMCVWMSNKGRKDRGGPDACMRTGRGRGSTEESGCDAHCTEVLSGDSDRAAGNWGWGGGRGLPAKTGRPQQAQMPFPRRLYFTALSLCSWKKEATGVGAHPTGPGPPPISGFAVPCSG